MRRLIVVAMVVFGSLGIGLAGAAPASSDPFCSIDEGCSPCLPGVVIAGKNSRVEMRHC